jgi:spore germination protein GerM
MIRTRTVALAMLVTGLAAGCGIPADEGPRAVPDEKLPENVDDGVAAADGETMLADLYFTRFDGERGGDVLVTIERAVPTSGSSSTPTPATVLQALLAGVLDDDEGADRIVTKIPANTDLASQPELVGSVLTVDLNSAISGVQGDGALFAYGQMACTADALDEVGAVRFTVEGESVAPPAGDGESSAGPLTCDSYANLLADPAG